MLVSFMVATPVTVLAQTTPAPTPTSGINDNFKGEACKGVLQSNAASCDDTGLMAIFEKVLSLLSFVIGAIAVLMIIVGGLRYVLSAGDPNSTKGAKDTIMYAIIGLIVAIVARGIVFMVANVF